MSFEKRFFVLCPSFHGATLFSKLLNAHPEIVSLGDTYPPNMFDATCGCGEKTSVCPFWQDVKRRMGDGYCAETPHWLPYYPGQTGSRAAGLRWTDHALNFRSPEVIARRIGRDQLDEFRSSYERFVAAIAAQPSSQGSVFVDGVKSIARVLSLLAAGAQVDGVIHLTRSPVDFVASSVRRKERSGVSWMFRRGLSYRMYHARVASLKRRLPVVRISYEALSEQTDSVLERVFGFVGVEPKTVEALRPAMDQEWHFLGNATLSRFDGTIRPSRHSLPGWQRGLIRLWPVRDLAGKDRPMHILFLIHSMSGGGAERVTANLANYWAAQGNDVTLVTIASADDDVYMLAPGVRRIALCLDGDSLKIGQAVLSNVRRIRAVRRVLRSERPDVAIGIMTMAGCTLGLAGGGLPCVTIGTERTHPPSLPLERAWSAIRRFSYGRLDAVVAQTEETAEWLRGNTRARRVTVIGNPVVHPLPRGAPLLHPADHLDPARRTLLAVGRLRPVKGYERLLRAFAAVVPEAPEWQLAIVGEGPSRQSLESLAQELEIADRVRLVGRAGNVADWYEAADLSVMTSLYEGFPNVLIEAMASGLPVVSVDCSAGPREIMRDGVDGLLVPNGDIDALARALRRVMSDADLRASLGGHAAEIRDRLSIARIAGEWEALVSRLRAARNR